MSTQLLLLDILLYTYTHHKHMHVSTHMHVDACPTCTILYSTHRHIQTQTHTQTTYTTDVILVIDPPTLIALLVEPTTKCFELTQFGWSNENKVQSL